MTAITPKQARCGLLASAAILGVAAIVLATQDNYRLALSFLGHVLLLSSWAVDPARMLVPISRAGESRPFIPLQRWLLGLAVVVYAAACIVVIMEKI